MFLSCTHRTMMSNLVTENLQQCLPKVRAETKNFQAKENRENGQKYTVSRLTGICGKAKLLRVLFYFCSAAL